MKKFVLPFSVLLICSIFGANSSAQQITLPFRSNLNEPVPIVTNVYPFKNELQMLEVDYESAWQQDVNRHEMERPRAIPWCSLITLPSRNVLLFRNRQGLVTSAFNTSQSLQYWNQKVKHISTTPTVASKERSAIFPFSNSIYLCNKRIATNLRNSYFLIDRMITEKMVDTSTAQLEGMINASGELIYPISYQYIEPVGDYYLVKQQGKIGLLNLQGKSLIPIQYDEIKMVAQQVVIFYQNGTAQKVYNASNKQIKDLDAYEWIDISRIEYNFFYHQQRPICMSKDGKRGLLDANLNELVSPTYQLISQDGEATLMAVCKNGEWGYINQQGKVVIPLQYDDATPFRNGSATVLQQNQYQCIDTTGEIIDNCPGKLESWTEVESRANESYIANRYIVKRSGRKGVVDQKGKLVVPLVYDHIVGIESNTSAYRWNKNHYKVMQYNQWGIIDKNGATIVPPIFTTIDPFKGGVPLMMVQQTGGYGLIDSNFKQVLPCRYENLDVFTFKGKYWFSQQQKWGLMDTDQRVLIAPQYDYHGWMKNGYIQVGIGKNYGIIDTTGKVVIPVQYKVLGTEFFNQMIIAGNGQHQGILNAQNEVMIPFIYNIVRNPEHPGAIGVQKGNRYGFVNSQHQQVSDFIYDFVDHYWTPLNQLQVVRQKKIGWVDVNGKEVIPCIYEDCNGYNSQGYHVKLNGTWMYVK